MNVTSRGATSTLSDSMLVLLDGRSIYQDFFGSVPGTSCRSTPPRSNRSKSFAAGVRGVECQCRDGVVNVVTKTRARCWATLAIRFGQFDRSPRGGPFDGGGLFSISATHAQATSDRTVYKISAGLLAQEAFLRPTGNIPGTQRPYPAFVNRGTMQPRLDARVDYDLGDGRQRVVLAGGIAGTEGIIHTGLGPLDAQRGSTLKYGRITYTRDKLRLQAFVNALDGDALVLLLSCADGRPLDFRFENQAYDVEVSDFHLIRARHLLSTAAIVGTITSTSFAGRGNSRDEGGAYGQDQIFLSGRYRWIVGARVDRFDVLKKAVVSPRTAFLIKPRPNQTFRVSFNRAFRAPSLVNTFLDTSFLNTLDLGSAGTFSFPTIAVGNDQLKEERLTAYEAGYIGRFGRTTLGGAVYLSRTKNQIAFTQTGSYTSSSPPPGWPLPTAFLEGQVLRPDLRT